MASDVPSADRTPKSPVVDVTVESDESVPLAVLRAVAAVTDTPPVGLPPLTDAVDPDALSAVVESIEAGGQVVFSYHGYAIRVSATETVEVYEAG